MSNNMDELREFYETLTPGGKQYLANKLWKEDRVLPQKVAEYVPEELKTPPKRFVKDELVIVTNPDKSVNDAPEGAVGMVVHIDPEDDHLPYMVDWGKDRDWFRVNMLESWSPMR